ncbi:MAG: hypothetical protein HYY17_10630 [Planctomycetes bacterium]|nr:hypothetical protein [Planctomycetota bacterium]
MTRAAGLLLLLPLLAADSGGGAPADEPLVLLGVAQPDRALPEGEAGMIEVCRGFATPIEIVLQNRAGKPVERLTVEPKPGSGVRAIDWKGPIPTGWNSSEERAFGARARVELLRPSETAVARIALVPESGLLPGRSEVKFRLRGRHDGTDFDVEWKVPLVVHAVGVQTLRASSRLLDLSGRPSTPPGVALSPAGSEIFGCSFWMGRTDNQDGAMRRPLERGTRFARATVTERTTLVPKKRGRVAFARADVVEEVRQVKPDEKIPVVGKDGRRAVSFESADGDGILIGVGTVAGLAATAGGVAFAGKRRGSDSTGGLPIVDGASQVFVGSDRPFEHAALSGPKIDHLPADTDAVLLDEDGRKVGELASYEGLSPENLRDARVRTLDARGTEIESAAMNGPAFSGDLVLRFDKKEYVKGDAGYLELANIQGAYRALGGSLYDVLKSDEIVLRSPDLPELNRAVSPGGEDRVRFPFTAVRTGPIEAAAGFRDIEELDEGERIAKEIAEKLLSWIKNGYWGGKPDKVAEAFKWSDNGEDGEPAGDGKLGPGEVERALKDAGIETPRNVSWSKVSRALIEKFDKNADGALDSDEFRKMLEALK